MTDQEFAEFHEARYAELTQDQRDRAKAILLAKLTPDVLEEVRELHGDDPISWASPYHHFWGMGIRNLLRQEGFKDAELPSGNWDDYYVAVVEYAAGIRT